MEVTKELISKYHLDQCTAAEKLAVEAWLADEEAEMSYPEDFNLDDYEAQGWERLSTRYDLNNEYESTDVLPITKVAQKRFWLSAAACIAFVSIVGISYSLFHNGKNVAAPMHYQTVNVKKGEKQMLVLTDGTQVWLNSESSLTFPMEFSAEKRTVRFTGEAFFKVAKNPERPFIISSPRTITRVLGTRFNLRDYQNEEKSELVVEEGKVSFSDQRKNVGLILSANQKGILDTKNKVSSRENVSQSTKYTDWKENKLVLDDITLEEIAPILERWYNIRVIAPKELNKERYKGRFNNPSLKEVLNSICIATRSKYTQHGKTFTIGK